MKNKNKIDEDAVVGAAATGGGEVVAGNANGAGDMVPGSKGTSVEDVLGKDCDHHKDGYLGPKCFHVPSRCGKLHRRIELPGTKKRKGQKNPYAQKVKIDVLNEEDLNIYNAIHTLTEDDFYDFLIMNIGIDAENLGEVIAVVKSPADSDTVYIKFKAALRSYTMKSYFAEAKFDGKKLIATNHRKPMSAAEIKRVFSEVAADIGNPHFKNLKLWVMWGEI